ncbi:MAG: 4Fe-4S binding protein [Pseudomonadota bacterium]|nr:4Fe-4S binding protein [Pseudomonadota bacterium]
MFGLGLCAWACACLPAFAGFLARADLERAFPPPYILGEKDDKLPVWPIFKQNATENQLVAYVYESVDLAPIPGFSGTPIDLLVALAPDGTFLEVKVVHFHEPVFVDGLGPEPLFDFVKQYKGKSLKQTIKVGPPAGGAPSDGAVVVVDGVAKATASVRILNETLLASGLTVAREKLGFAKGRDPSRAARLRADAFRKLDWAGLVAAGYLKHYRVSNVEAEAPFKGTDAEGLDPDVRAHPDATFIELWVGELDAPMVGRNLIGDKAFDRLVSDLDGRHALLVASTGRYSFMGEDYVAGAAPTRLTLAQSGAPVEIRDFAWRKPIPQAPPGDLAVFVIKPQTGWDPAATATLALLATREKGQILPERISHDFGFPYATPADLLILPPPEEAKGALGVWRDRALDTGIIALALAGLTAALLAQKRLTARAARFTWARRAFLVFTLLFIGFWAQAQLSIVSLIGLARAARGQGSLAFLLYDPPSLVLWGFTLASLVVWGRGTFCGWLCPFGAMQELAADFGRWLGIKPIRIPDRWDAGLKYLKYVALAGVLLAAAIPNAPAETLAEIEPFKTAITLEFVRSLPFVLYAAGLVVGGMFAFKFFCRYLCPLGAAFALVGLLRRWNWLPRRVECGDPCQLCKAKCRYNAIPKSGAVVYRECFQCMDCVVIHNDARQCVPLVLAAKRNARRLETRRAAE